MTTFCNNNKKDWFSHGIGLVFVHGENFKDRLRTLPQLKWSSLQQLLMEKSCKGLHLICNKVLGSALDLAMSCK